MPLAARCTKYELQASFHLRQDKTHLELVQIRASPTTNFLLQVGLDSNYHRNTTTRQHAVLQETIQMLEVSSTMLYVRLDTRRPWTHYKIVTATILTINHNNRFDGVVGYHVSLTTLVH